LSIRRIYASSFVALAGALTPTAAFAAETTSTSTAPTTPTGDPQLGPIIAHFRVWLAGLLGVGATLMLTVAGVLYMSAGGNPTQIEKAKTAFRSALVGYALAALAPILVTVLKGLTA
jgi:hypothetical protein